MNSGFVYSEEKTKGHTVNKKEIIRDRKKYEKGEALGSFKVVSYYDNLWYEQAYTTIDDKTKRPKMILINVPNYTIIKQLVETELRHQIQLNNSKHKLTCYITIKYIIDNDGDEEERFFNSQVVVLNSSHMIHSFVNNLISSFENELEETKNSSNVTFQSIEKLDIKTAKSKAIIGGSYIELPEFIKNKKACINIQNEDEKCFIWSLLAYKYYEEFKKQGCKNKASTYKNTCMKLKNHKMLNIP